MSSKKKRLEGSSRFNQDVNSGYAEKRIKLEPVEEGTLNPVFDEEYFRRNAMSETCDPTLDPSKTNGNENKNPILSENTGPHSENVKTVFRKCPICANFVPQKTMKAMTLEEDKSVLAAMIPDKFFHVDKAHELLKMKRVRICFEHNIEASTRIEKYINDPKAIEKMLIPKIKSVNPNLSTERASCIFTQFLFRNKKKMVKLTRDILNFHCKLCNRLEPHSKRALINSIHSKLVFMVGCIIRGKQSLEEAHIFIETKHRQAVCRKHAEKAIKKIMSFLNIENVRQFSNCSSELMKDLMITVNNLLPDMTIPQFKKAVQQSANKVLPSQDATKASNNKTHCCVVCKRTKPVFQVATAWSLKVKSVIMVGCILRKTCTMDFAKKIVTRIRNALICKKHYKKAVKTILESLHIQSALGISNCSESLMKDLMQTVNELLPEMTILEFKEAVYDMARKVEKFKEQENVALPITEAATEEPEEVESIKDQETCGVCHLLHPKDKFVSVKSKKSKMLIMLGCVIRETHTTEEALQFISSGKGELSCRRHFRKAIQKVLEFLEVGEITEISSCSKKNVKKLMLTVNGLLPKMTQSEFREAVRKMVRKIEMFEEQKELTQ